MRRGVYTDDFINDIEMGRPLQRDRPIAERCDLVYGALAEVGIIAVVKPWMTTYPNEQEVEVPAIFEFVKRPDSDRELDEMVWRAYFLAGEGRACLRCYLTKTGGVDHPIDCEHLVEWA